MEGDTAWHHGQTLAAGQVAEFKVWAELVRQSGGQLHVFLPLRDMGLDGVLHRLSDGAYLPVQVKGRMSLTPAGQVHITVTANSLIDDDAFLIATLVDGAELGRYVLVTKEVEFRRLAASDVIDGREYLTAAFELRHDGDSRWAPYLVPRERLAERFGAAPTAAQAAAPPLFDRAQEGFIGEAEVIRRLATVDDLALFRPFPDLETVEVLAWSRSTHGFVGLQVKTSGYETTNQEARVYFRVSSFRAGGTTIVCVLGWDRMKAAFAESCLLIPSTEIAGLTRIEGEWMVLELEPGGASHRRLEKYRIALVRLGGAVKALIYGV